MPRKNKKPAPGAIEDTSEPLPTNVGLSDKSTFSDYPDSFFTKGVVKSLAGTSNILIVAPNMSPDTLDKNIGLLVCELAETLGAYAVVNCRRYRKPREDDPAPEELHLSNSPRPTKETEEYPEATTKALRRDGRHTRQSEFVWFRLNSRL